MRFPSSDQMAVQQLTTAECMQPRIVALAEEVDVLRSALAEVRELIDGYVDIRDGVSGSAQPNDAMKAANLIDEVLR